MVGQIASNMSSYDRTICLGAASVAAILGLLWALYQLRLLHIGREFDARLHERFNERTRIARELHDTLLQSIHGVMFCVQAAANVLPDRPLEAKQRLETALQHSAHAIREGRDAVQGLRASATVTNDLAIVLSTLGEELAASQIADAHSETSGFNVAIHGTPRTLRPVIQEDIYRIASEALCNAFRHARARRIELDIRYDDRQFQLRVRDDGQGIDAAVPEGYRAGHFGLLGMRERAEQIGGYFEVWSDAGMGTEVALTIPGVVVYASPRARRDFWSFVRPTRANS
jgi:signal transduction histidine kinase